MRNLKPRKRKRAANTLSRETIFGPAPILRGEDKKAFDLLFKQVSALVTPSDIVERIWVNDIVVLTWEILRHRRSKQGLIELIMKQTLTLLLGVMVPRGNDMVPFDPIAKKWIQEDPETLEFVDELLAAKGFTMNTVRAQAFAFKLGDIERIERLIAAAEVRRNRALSEIDYRRDFARRMRKTIDEVDGNEIKTVNPVPLAPPQSVNSDEQ